MDKKRKYFVTLFKIVIAVMLVWYLFQSGRLTKESFIKLLNPYHLPFLSLSAFAFVASQALSSARIIFLIHTINVPLKFPQAFRLTMVGNFFNIAIPGMIGGDIVKGFYLTKIEEDCKGRSSGIVIIDRVIGLFALLLIGSASIVYLLQTGNPNLLTYQQSLKSIIIFCTTVIFLFILFIFLSKNKLIRKWIKDTAYRVFSTGFFYYIMEGLGAVTKKRRYLIYASLISIVIQIICLSGLVVLTNLTGTRMPDIIALMAASSLVMLAGVIPVTPGNIGWTEFLATFGWSAVGSNSGAEVFLYWRIVTILCSLPGGLFYFLSFRFK